MAFTDFTRHERSSKGLFRKIGKTERKKVIHSYSLLAS